MFINKFPTISQPHLGQEWLQARWPRGPHLSHSPANSIGMYVTCMSSMICLGHLWHFYDMFMTFMTFMTFKTCLWHLWHLWHVYDIYNVTFMMFVDGCYLNCITCSAKNIRDINLPIARVFHRLWPSVPESCRVMRGKRHWLPEWGGMRRNEAESGVCCVFNLRSCITFSFSRWNGRKSEAFTVFSILPYDPYAAWPFHHFHRRYQGANMSLSVQAMFWTSLNNKSTLEPEVQPAFNTLVNTTNWGNQIKATTHVSLMQFGLWSLQVFLNQFCLQLFGQVIDPFVTSVGWKWVAALGSHKHHKPQTVSSCKASGASFALSMCFQAFGSAKIRKSMQSRSNRNENSWKSDRFFISLVASRGPISARISHRRTAPDWQSSFPH